MSTSACPDPKNLSGYAIGALPLESAVLIEEHVQSCPDCEATLNSIDSSGDTIMACLRLKAPLPAEAADATMMTDAGFDEAVSVPAAAAATPAADGALQTLGNYILFEKIGAGGMGQVYKARHRRMDRVVALKVLPAHLMKDEHAIARFEREVKAAARISHPNIVAAYDADQAGDVHFLVMEYVEGVDLSALVKRSGPLPVERAVDCILQAARGLQAAHAEKIVHRDIKPANLLLDRKGTVKILDMGLARINGNEAQQAELTASGAVMGTVDYMAPEQALDTRTADARADIYSLGCTLYYLLSGHAAYQGETLTARLLAHQSHPIPELRAVCPNGSGALESVFRKMVAKDLNARYQTMDELIADLERLQDSSVATAEAPRDARSAKPQPAQPSAIRTEPLQAGGGGNRPKRWTIAAGAAAVLAALAIVVISVKTDDGTLLITLDEKDAKIEIDGKEVTLKQKTLEAGVIKISVDPGKHRIIVQKDGFETYSNNDVEIKTGQGTSINAALIPKGQVASNSKSPKTDTPPVAVVKPKPADDADPWAKQTRALPAEKQVEAVIAKLRELNPRWEGTLKKSFGQVSGWELELQAAHLSDISPLRVWNQLRTLNISSATVLSDLSPLEGMPLTALFVSSPLLTDLSPLRGLPLQSLHISANSLTDLTPLSGLPLKELNLDGSNVSDLSPLRGAPLETLTCGFTNVSDLTPLQGMPLSTLQIGMTRVADLSPLRGMRFKSLKFVDTPLADLSPLAGMRIIDLDCSGSAVSDVSPLKDVQVTTLRFTPMFITRGMDVLRDHKSLRTVVANGHELVEKDPLTVQKFWEKIDAGEFRPQQPSQLPGQPEFIQWAKSVSALPAAQQVEAVAKKLRELNPGFDGIVQHQIRNDVVTGLQLDATRIADISPVRALAGLEELTCTSGLPGFRRSFSDLSPLKGMRLKKLEVNARVADLSPLAGMPLERLDLGQNPVTDLSPLKGMPLTSLQLSRTCVSDLSALQGLGLVQLDVSRTEVADLSPLKDMPLRSLNCDYTRVADLSPLAGVPLESLWVSGTLVSDLGPLADVPLTELYFANNRVSDITPLGKTALKIVEFTPRNISRGVEVLRQLPLERIYALDREGRAQHTPAEFFDRDAEGAFGKPASRK